MKYAPLPFLQAIEGLQTQDPEQAKEVLKQTIKQFFGSDAAQTLAGCLRAIESDALDSIRKGEQVERNVGRMSAVEDIRGYLAALLPDSEKDQAEILEDEGIEEFAVHSDFLIPYPDTRSGAEGE